MLAQIVALAARRFQIEDEVLDVELQLIDGILGDADEPALQAGEVADAVAKGNELFPQGPRQSVEVIAQLDQLGGKLLVVPPF